MKSINEAATNKFTIIGRLLDATFAEGKTKDGRVWNRANFTVRTTQQYNGRTETSEIPLTLFAPQYTKQNTPHPGFKNIQELKEMKTVQNYGEQEAAVIRTTSGQVEENMFIARSGQLVNNWRLTTSFLSETGHATDIASFNVDVFILDMFDEVDRDGDPTGRLVIKGGVVQFGGRLDIIEFIAEAPEYVDYIQRNYNVNDTVNLGGRVRWTSVEEKRAAKENSWGESLPETSTHIVRELIVTRGSDEPFEEEFAYDPAEIRKAFNVRKANIEQLQFDATHSGAQASSSGAPSKYSWN